MSDEKKKLWTAYNTNSIVVTELYGSGSACTTGLPTISDDDIHHGWSRAQQENMARCCKEKTVNQVSEYSNAAASRRRDGMNKEPQFAAATHIEVINQER